MSIVLYLGTQAVHGYGKGMIINKIATAIPQAFQKDLPGENITSIIGE